VYVLVELAGDTWAVVDSDGEVVGAGSTFERALWLARGWYELARARGRELW
jgi:hypothetical protein